jgi:hypothetical protein
MRASLLSSILLANVSVGGDKQFEPPLWPDDGRSYKTPNQIISNCLFNKLIRVKSVFGALLELYKVFKSTSNSCPNRHQNLYYDSPYSDSGVWLMQITWVGLGNKPT